MHHTTREVTSPTERDFPSEFARDVYMGLKTNPKWLSSKYFYDDRGDEIFRQIMRMPSYYLTNSEFEIFDKRADDILESIGTTQPFRIIELGAGDGYKTSLLLEHFMENEIDFTYAPCDISWNVLQILEEKLTRKLPNLSIELLHGDYFKVLAEILKKDDGRKNVVFFLGANIGNFTSDRAGQFLSRIRGLLHPGDQLMIGFDLKKDPETILTAYNDPQGITANFNLNLLQRINTELSADFDLDQFFHRPYYDPETGECRSYLISKLAQEVRLKSIGEKVRFKAWETIFMEISKKYSLEEIDELSVKSGFSTLATIRDSRHYFADVLWEAI